MESVVGLDNTLLFWLNAKEGFSETEGFLRVEDDPRGCFEITVGWGEGGADFSLTEFWRIRSRVFSLNQDGGAAIV